MLTLPNVATSDAYTAACTLGPVATAQQIVFVVANAAAIAQIAPLLSSGTLGDWGDEILLTPQANVVQRAGGIRFRSAVAGVSAQIVAQLIEPADPAPGAGTPFTAKLTSSGGVTPGAASVQIQKNGALIGTEAILDFEAAWSVTDDAANTRVKVSLAVPVVATIAALNAAYDGAPQTGARGILKVGTDYVQLVYDAVYGHWVSDEKSVGDSTNPRGGINFAAGAGVFAVQIADSDFSAKVAAGLQAQLRCDGWLLTDGMTPNTNQLEWLLRFRHLTANAEDLAEYAATGANLMTEVGAGNTHGLDTGWTDGANPGVPKSIFLGCFHFVNNESIAASLQWTVTLKLRWRSI